MLLELIRDDDPDVPFNYGKLYCDHKLVGETLEDKDRRLEHGGEKVQNETAIPRGRYQVVLSMSRRFQKIMPEVKDVPGFLGVRIHGGNTEANTEGCPLLGAVRTKYGIAQCKGVNDWLITALKAAEQRGEEVWMEVT